MSEKGAQYGSQKADALVGIGRFIAQGIGPAKGEHARVDAFDKTIAAGQASRQHCFGMIMVCVGKGGLPDDVHVVSISRRARTQNLSESAITLEIQKGGALLFTAGKFMQMVEGVVRGIREGKLRLPILPEQLTAKLVPAKRPSLIIKRIDV